MLERLKSMGAGAATIALATTFPTHVDFIKVIQKSLEVISIP